MQTPVSAAPLRALVFDLETNGLLPEVSTVHCLVIRDITTGAVHRFRRNNIEDSIYHGVAMLMELANTGVRLVAHNGIDYDVPVLRKLFPNTRATPFESCVYDTMVQARVMFPDLRDRDTRLIAKGRMPRQMFKRHSLAAWGYRLKEYKGEYSDGWVAWSQKMEDYCVQDTATTEKLYLHLLEQKWPQESTDLEHGVAWIIARQKRFGVCFDVDAANALIGTLIGERAKLCEDLARVFPPFWKGGRTKAFKKTMRCQLPDLPPISHKPVYAGRGKARVQIGEVPIYPTSYHEEGAEYTPIVHTDFNPGSRHHIALALGRRYGWEPAEYTETGDPKIDETVLEALPYPEAKVLARYFMVDKRLGQIAEGKEAWLKSVKNGRIHGSVNTNGTVTGRMSHSHPNLGQVPAGRSEYGPECRALFGPPPGYVMVGADADALELRDFAGYVALYDGGAYIEVVLKGDKKQGTDMHSVNCRALGMDPKGVQWNGEAGRDVAKTWFYAFLYGAGDEKLGTILTGKRDAAARMVGAQSRKRFLKNLKGLGTLVDKVKEKAKVRKHLIGLDGRRLPVRSQHAALNTLLQSAGAVQMKLALTILDRDLRERGWKHSELASNHFDYEFVLNVHDEWQLATKEEIADEVGKCAVEAIRKAGVALGFRCPLDGESRVGRNWNETH